MTPQAISGLPTWLHMLAQVYPPHSVALVGAGNGTGPLVQWLLSHASQAGQESSAPPAVTLLEPHAPSMAQLAKRLAATQACAEWRLLPELLAPEPGEHTYHQYTLAAENGLLPPEALHPLWPSLQLQSQQLAATVPLADLLPVGWLLLDCLPAAHLLQGTRLPASTQVVLARVVLSDTAPAGSSLASVQALLAESGFKAVATFVERNSALGKALFVRDPKGLQDNIDQSLAKAQALEADKAQLTEAKDQALAQVQQLAQEKAQAQQRCDELVKAKEAETAAKQSESRARSAEQQGKEQALAKAQALEAEKAKLTEAKDKALAQVQQLAQEKAQALQRCDELAKAKEAETKANVELQSQLEQLNQAFHTEKAAKQAESQARMAEQQAKDQALAKVETLEADKAQLTDAKDKALAQVQQLAQEKAQAQQRCDELAKNHSELQIRLNAEEKNASELETYKKRAIDLQKQVDSVMNRFAKTLIDVQRVKQRINAQEQLHQLQPSNKEANSQPLQLTAEFNLGEAWAGNTVNTVIFRHHGIFTHQGHQFTSFYVDEHTLRFVCRRLSDDHITHYDLAGEYNLKDAHNSISMGVDRDGYLHMCFDQHATKLRYRRSLKPISIDGWTDDQPMTGQHEERVTYPTFILPRAGYPLTLLYRDGTHNKGCARLKYYDERTQSWKDKPTPILSGAEQKPWTSNAYWNHPAIGTDGSLHLSFVWRTGVLGDEQLVNNINIGYAWSPDNGHHWYTLQGQPYQVPITPTTAETIWPVPPGSNLINQCSMALDAYNRPHIVFYANDADGIPQYQHLRYDGKTWHHQTLSQRTQPFNLTGGGTLQIPISRPGVLLDAQGNALVIYRGDLTDDRMAVTRLVAPSYGVEDATQHVLHTDSLGHAEPVLDREGWKLNQKLSMLLQHNRQPNHDENIATAKAPVRLCEFELK